MVAVAEKAAFDGCPAWRGNCMVKIRISPRLSTNRRIFVYVMFAVEWYVKTIISLTDFIEF